MHTPHTVYHHSHTNHHYASHTPVPHHVHTHTHQPNVSHSPTANQPINQDHNTPATSYITHLPKQPQHTTAIYPHSDTRPLLSLMLSCSFFFFLSLFLSCFLFFLSLFPLYLLLYSTICYSTLLYTTLHYSWTQYQLTTALLLQHLTFGAAKSCSYHQHQRHNHSTYTTCRQNLLHMVCHNRDIWKKKKKKKEKEKVQYRSLQLHIILH